MTGRAKNWHMRLKNCNRMLTQSISTKCKLQCSNMFVIFIYLSSLQVANLSDAPRGRLVVMGDSARIQDETAENSAWFFNVLGV